MSYVLAWPCTPERPACSCVAAGTCRVVLLLCSGQPSPHASSPSPTPAPKPPTVHICPHMLVLTTSWLLHVQDLAAMSNVEYIPGGAGQNSTRVCQWMLQVPKAAAIPMDGPAGDLAAAMLRGLHRAGSHQHCRSRPAAIAGDPPAAAGHATGPILKQPHHAILAIRR
jgi:hypothetical protein